MVERLETQDSDSTGFSEKRLAMWLFICLFLSVWMFVLGIFVGRGTFTAWIFEPDNPRPFPAASYDRADDNMSALIQTEQDRMREEVGRTYYRHVLPDKKAVKKTSASVKQEKQPPVPLEEIPAAIRTSPETTRPADTGDDILLQPPIPDTPMPAAASATSFSDTDRNSTTGHLCVQAGAFRHQPEAEKRTRRIILLGFNATTIKVHLAEKGVWHRVRICNISDRSEAVRIKGELAKQHITAIVVKP